MTPKEVYYGNQETIQKALERSLIYRKKKIWRGSTQDTNINPGDHVRVAIRSDPESRKLRAFKKKGYDQQFSDEIYVVRKHLIPRTPLGNHVYKVEGKTQRYYRSELQLVSSETNNEVPDETRFQ